MRTPLNGVIGFAELLKDEVAGPLNARQAGFVADIHASGLRLLALIESILAMAEIDVDDLRPAQPVDIAPLLAERAEAHRGAAQARGVSIVLAATPEPGRAAVNAAALRRVLDVLLDNAVKFNREGGSVDVQARRSDAALEIAVVDTGVGIAQEDLQKLFQPFEQLDSSLARQHGGLGLSLAAAQRLAELQGGTIEVESQPGKGTTFKLRLPVETAA